MKRLERRFTPGPWAVVATTIGPKCTVGTIGQAYPPETGMAGLSDEYTVGLVPYVTDESAYNANLIAAAPELFDELERLVRMLGLPDGHRGEGRKMRATIEAARSLLARACTATPFAPAKAKSN